MGSRTGIPVLRSKTREIHPAFGHEIATVKIDNAKPACVVNAWNELQLVR